MMTRPASLACVVAMLVSSCSAGQGYYSEVPEVLAACDADPTSECCRDDDCEDSAVCDFSFVCAQGPNRDVTCGTPTGDRKCHALCDEDVACADPGASCVETVLFDGADYGQRVSMCR